MTLSCRITEGERLMCHTHRIQRDRQYNRVGKMPQKPSGHMQTDLGALRKGFLGEGAWD